MGALDILAYGMKHGYSDISGIFNLNNYEDGIYNGIVDLSEMPWNNTKASVGTDGTYMKCHITYKGKTFYLKAPLFDKVKGFYGHESYCEYICSRLGRLLNYNVLNQYLINCVLKVNNESYDAVVCLSESYRRIGEYPISMETFSGIHNLGNTVEDIRMYPDYMRILSTMVFDYTTGQMDRHGHNMEYLTDRKLSYYRLAPMFDNGLCLTASINDDYMKYTDEREMWTGPVNNYFGSKDLYKNLVDFCVGKVRVVNIELSYSLVSTLCKFVDKWLLDYWFDMLCNRYNKAKQILNQ